MFSRHFSVFLLLDEIDGATLAPRHSLCLSWRIFRSIATMQLTYAEIS